MQIAAKTAVAPPPPLLAPQVQPEQLPDFMVAKWMQLDNLHDAQGLNLETNRRLKEFTVGPSKEAGNAFLRDFVQLYASITQELDYFKGVPATNMPPEGVAPPNTRSLERTAGQNTLAEDTANAGGTGQTGGAAHPLLDPGAPVLPLPVPAGFATVATDTAPPNGEVIVPTKEEAKRKADGEAMVGFEKWCKMAKDECGKAKGSGKGKVEDAMDESPS